MTAVASYQLYGRTSIGAYDRVAPDAKMVSSALPTVASFWRFAAFLRVRDWRVPVPLLPHHRNCGTAAKLRTRSVPKVPVVPGQIRNCGNAGLHFRGVIVPSLLARRPLAAQPGRNGDGDGDRRVHSRPLPWTIRAVTALIVPTGIPYDNSLLMHTTCVRKRGSLCHPYGGGRMEFSVQQLPLVGTQRAHCAQFGTSDERSTERDVAG
jgi:hypothetical protein